MDRNAFFQNQYPFKRVPKIQTILTPPFPNNEERKKEEPLKDNKCHSNVETGVRPIFILLFETCQMYSLVRSVPRFVFAARSLTCTTRLYHDLVIDHYEHPRNVGMCLIRA